MKAVLKKIGLFTMVAALPGFVAADVGFSVKVAQGANNLDKERHAIIREFSEGDVFGREKAIKLGEYEALFDEGKISDGEFKVLVQKLDEEKFIEEKLREKGSDEEKSALEKVDNQIDNFKQGAIYAGSGMLSGTAMAGLTFALGVSEIKDEKKAKEKRKIIKEFLEKED